jgi:hypothetical protein
VIIYLLGRMASCLLGFTLGYVLTNALGSWTEALVVITCLYILFRDDSRRS